MGWNEAYSVLLPQVVAIAREAGEAIMRVYGSADFGVEQKVDDSPLTLADRAAHEIIYSGLTGLADCEVLSEEGREAPWDNRQTWQRYWLVDPLDGTKEFIKRNGEFTVNIALIENGVPVLGVVLAPALDVLYLASSDLGAYKCDLKTFKGDFKTLDPSSLAKIAQPLQVAALPEPGASWRVVGSRSHQSEAFQQFMQQLPGADIVSMGSSLKLCLVAEGAADLYPRLGPTSEWDTAAAQAVVEAAGGQVIHAETGQPLRYNQKAGLLNPFFIVCAGRSECWSLPESLAL